MASVINQIKFNDIEYAIAASAYAECSTAADIAAKTATICTDGDTTNTGFALVKGVSVKVKFTVTNTASSPTLNINGTGAKAIMYRGSAINKGYLAANRVYEFVYDGTDWELVGDINSAATQSADGLMSANDKKKLDEIASGATKITVDASLSSTSTNPIQNKIVNSALEAKTDAIKWSCPTKVGAYSCVCELSSYGTGILTLIFDQNSQAVVHTYMVGTSYLMAQLYQIGTNGYSIYADQIVRVVQGSSATKFIVEVLNNYGYSGATTVTAGCTYIPLTNSTTCTPYTAYTATSSAPTVKATVESKYNGIVAPQFYGNLVGNAATATNVAWSGITEKPSTFTPSSHTHSISQITSLQSSLNAKLSTSGGTLKGNLTIDGGHFTAMNRISTRSVGGNSVADYSIVFNDITDNNAPGKYSIAAGYYTYTSNTGEFAVGTCNKVTSSSLFTVGKGHISDKLHRENAAYISNAGQMYLAGSLLSNGADYAEYFEWEDNNINNEDRRGYFVTLHNEKIKIAKSGDYILGVVSALPTIVGNGDIDWQGRYIKDEFGAILTEMVDCVEGEKINEITGEIIPIIKKMPQPKQNPNYNPERQYIPREQRPEWAAVGMMGVLSVRDDGTCQVNSYCKVTDEGTATASNTGYRVIARVNDHVIKIVLK